MKKILLFIFLIFILSSCNALKITTCNPIYAMNTTINIKFYNVDDYNDHYNKLKEIYYKYDMLADDFKERSNVNNIYDLNNKRKIEASSDLIELINESILLKEKTNGYFNPLVGRLSHLWKEAIEDETDEKIKLITEDVIKKEIDIINSSSIKIENNNILIEGDANIDLGAIAKGYATYQCVKYLKENNIEGYLIDAGESSVSLGTKGGNDFKIVLEAPYSNKIIKTLEYKNTSISTSSGKYQHKIYNNIKYHHIINPYTGYPSNIYDNVNIIYDNSFYADCYSTALFNMNLNEAKEFILNNNLKAILYKDDKILYEEI